MILVPLHGGIFRGGAGGADTKATGFFFCNCFKLGTLALTA